MYVYTGACQETDALRSLGRELYTKKEKILVVNFMSPVIVFKS